MGKNLLISAFFLCCFGTTVFGQISEGGIPRKVVSLKAATKTTVNMPYISNDQLRWQNEQRQQETGLLKPLTFAHPFEVNLSPVTNGNWGRSDDGWWIWQLAIKSENAFSLNLLFERFKLPEKARLFLFTPDQKYLLGAFTHNNNSELGILTVAPLPGDEIVIQYEIPDQPGNSPDFVITRVNHDFIGILKYVDTRRPMGITAGDCNKDVNCVIADRWRSVQNSVCRIMVLGLDLCSATLVNNTNENQIPYVLTANHCIDSPLKASGTLFLFNYESPYCGPLDGDVTNSLAGSKLKATLDSLDFTLVEMTTPPPPSFRPYYAGWSRSTQLTDTVASIHHPQGDIKKIAIDNEVPVNATFLSSFVKNAFWKILKWDVGTTEIGSSGGPILNRSAQLFGSLSGGAAICSNPVNDYFFRFDLAWNYRSDSTKQLKHWLDPVGNNPLTLNGKQFNTGENLCATFTNLIEGDTHKLLRVSSTTGYWTGTNSEGITEVAEKFKIPGDETLIGVYVGIGMKYQPSLSSNSYISVKVYNLDGQTPVLLAVKDTVYLKNLAADAMNYIKFNSSVAPSDSFLIAVNFDNVKTGDSLAIYQALRKNSADNSFWLKKSNKWVTFKEDNNSGYSGALAFSVLACNVGGQKTDSTVIKQNGQVMIWPNPTNAVIQIQTSENLTESQVSVFNLLGQKIRYQTYQTGPRNIEMNLNGNMPGIYLVRIKNGNKYYCKRVLLLSY